MLRWGRMKIRFCFILAGAVAMSYAASPTLIDIPQLPSNELKAVFSPEQWGMLQRVPYAGYVHFTADVDDTGKLRRVKLADASPGDGWAKLAEARLDKVVISAANIGTHIKPRASAWVIFYGPGKDDPPNGDKLMVIYAKPTNYNRTSGPGERGERPYFEITVYK